MTTLTVLNLSAVILLSPANDSPSPALELEGSTIPVIESIQELFDFLRGAFLVGRFRRVADGVFLFTNVIEVDTAEFQELESILGLAACFHLEVWIVDGETALGLVIISAGDVDDLELGRSSEDELSVLVSLSTSASRQKRKED